MTAGRVLPMRLPLWLGVALELRGDPHGLETLVAFHCGILMPARASGPWLACGCCREPFDGNALRNSRNVAELGISILPTKLFIRQREDSRLAAPWVDLAPNLESRPVAVYSHEPCAAAPCPFQRALDRIACMRCGHEWTRGWLEDTRGRFRSHHGLEVRHLAFEDARVLDCLVNFAAQCEFRNPAESAEPMRRGDALDAFAYAMRERARLRSLRRVTEASPAPPLAGPNPNLPFYRKR